MILSDNETKVDLLNNEAIAKTIVSLIRDSKDQPISIGILYLRVLEFYKKWNKHRLQNWAMIRNQLLADERMAKLMKHYDVIY